MSVLVTDAGFGPDTFSAQIVSLAELSAHPDSCGVDLNSDDSAQALAPWFGGLLLVRIAFPAFNDGRGFTIARDLRRMGYRGRLRAAGYLLADQYAMARRVGFDEVEIDAALAARQPEAQWRARADWRAHDHRACLFV